jgi:hypothetical protein
MNRRDCLQGALWPALAMHLPAVAAHGADDPLLLEILSTASPTVRRVLANRATYEPQILWTRLKPLSDGGFERISEHRLGVERRRWFAAASFVKLPLAALLFEELEKRGLARNLEHLRLQVDRSCAALPARIAGGWPLMRLVRSMLIVSDNPCFNALYELIGSDAIHARLATLGYRDLTMPTRMGGCGVAHKARAVVVDSRGKPVWESPASAQELPQRFAYGKALKGRAWQAGASQVPGPHDFSASNFIALEDLQRLFLDLTGVVAAPEGQRFALSVEAHALLRNTLSTLPRECSDPRYPESAYADNHAKFLGVGGAPQRLPGGLTIANKNAESYGFIGDCALIEERAAGIAFALAAVVYVNRDGVLNDARYEYAEIGLPFLRELGEAVLAHERGQRPPPA